MTLGDYWGIKNHHKEFDNRNGVSLILVNTTKGKELLNNSRLRLLKSKLDYAIEGNGILEHPSQKSNCRDVLYNDVKRIGYEAALDRHIKTYPQFYNTVLTHFPKFIIDILAQVKS